MSPSARVGLYQNIAKDKAARANQGTNLLKMLRGKTWGSNKKTLMTLYKQFIRPILEYGAVATAGAAASAIKHLELAERRALRIATMSSRFISNKILCERANIQPLGERLECLK